MLDHFFEAAQVRRSERPAFSWACVWFATLLGGYFMVRPVREALGSVGGGKDLQLLFALVFVTMLVAVPVYSQLVSRFRRRIVVPVVYRFLMINLLIFAAVINWPNPQVQMYVTRVFFVWVSVYVLFATSLFWSVMVDSFTSDQGKRLFGPIAGCGTLGAMLGSFFASQVTEHIGVSGLLVFPALLMELGLWCYRRLEASRSSLVITEQLNATGGHLLSGFVHVARSPYLLTICSYILFTALCGTSLYLTQARIVDQTYPDEEARVAVFAWVDLVTQALTIILQLLVAGFLMKRSLALALMVLPLTYLLGFAMLGFAPVFATLVTVVVLARAVTYGITVPAQGVLFTVVSREDKYKAKSVIDTLVTRGGDAVASRVGDQLRSAGVALTVVSWSMIPLTIVWAALAWMLGRSGLKRAQAAAETNQ